MHNYDGGSIQITLTEDNLVFSNASTQVGLDPLKIFERFYKDNTSDATKSGLAILKQVYIKQNYELSYYYQREQRHFKIVFNSSERD